MDISTIDRRFAVEECDGKAFQFFDVTRPPFVLEGLPWFEENQRRFLRLPASFTTEEVNAGALELSHHTAGVSVRFRSASSQIALRAKLAYSADMNHMTRLGSSGFDLYRGVGRAKFHCGSAQVGRDQTELLLILTTNREGGNEEYTLNFPLYGGVESVEIGLEPGCVPGAPEPHHITRPILFYGSSITQGGCASRPGMAYSSILCRAVDAPQINLGFSGSGKGEIAVAKAIAGLELSCFVMDYDYNAPDAAYLRQTHEPFFKTVRQAHPELPILLVTRPDVWRHTDYAAAKEREEVIRTTWRKAVADGDRHVWLIPGERLFGEAMRNECTVDGCHPNDLGFFRMAQTILPILRQALLT